MKSPLPILLFLITCVSVTFFPRCGSTVDNEDTIISISGHVMKNNGVDTVGAPGVKVRLAKTGLSDSTDKNGFYSIQATQSGLEALGVSIDTLQDTVIMTSDNKVVYREKVEQWIVTLPTVYLIQRNIQGKLDTKFFDPSTTLFSRIDVIIKYADVSKTDSAVIKAYYFKETSAYSCFAYFQNIGSQLSREFSICARVYDSLSHLLGQSRTLRFNNTAGNIDLPAFNPFNALPKSNAGNDTTVSVNDTVRLSGTAIDSFGTIVKREWDFGNTGNFIACDSGQIVSKKVSGTPDSNFRCIYRVTNSNKNVASDTLKVTIVQAVPIVNLYAEKAVVLLDSPIILHANVTNLLGRIINWEWDFGATGMFKNFAGDSVVTVKAPPTPVSNYKCIVRVTDDDGTVVSDTVIISVSAGIVNGFAAVVLKDSVQSTIVPLYDINDSTLGFNWISMPGTRGAVRVDAQADSILWFCRNDSTLWEFRGGSFRQNDIVTGSSKKAFDISVNLLGFTFAAGEGSTQNFYFMQNAKQWISGQGLVKRVDIAATGVLECGAIGTWDDLYYLDFVSGWTNLGSFTGIEVSSGQTYYAISHDSLLYRWNKSSSIWNTVTLPSAAGKPIRVETNMNDEVLIVDSKNSVYFRNNKGVWSTVTTYGKIARVLDITLF